ncbi:MAG TPA: hypothetical protein VIF57_18110 [Polyangia bacterium]
MAGWARLCSVVCWAGLLVGCAHAPRQTKFMASLPGVTMSTDELRARVFELGRRESALVEEAVYNIYNSTEELPVRRTAVTWGLKAIPSVQEATMHPDPLVAFGDQWALALQTEAFAREGPGRERLGAAYVFVERAAQKMEYECEQVAALVFPSGAAGPRQRVHDWARANPITAATFARPSAGAAWPGAMKDKDHSALGFIASTDDRLTLLSARMEMMNETLLDRVRWTTELIVADALGTGNVARFLDSAEAVVDKEHDKLVEDISEQRDQLFAQLDQQREAAFGNIARERADIFEQVAGERAAIAAQADALLKNVKTDTRALIDRTLLYIGVGAALLIVLAALALWIVWHSMRRPRGPERRDRRRIPASEPLTAPTA